MNGTEAVRATCLRVPKRDGERARRLLAAAGELRTDLIIKSEGDCLLLPCKAPRAEERPGYGADWVVCEADFERATRGPVSYRELVNVPVELRPLLPRSFDVIGRVILIKIPEELTPFERDIGRALLATRPSCVSVARDRGVRGGERVRDLRVIAGDENLETVHTEHGLKLAVDPSRVYFSPRLATERLRVSNMVSRGERVLDLFAGVGPFSILIAKCSQPSSVVAVDINPDAIELLRRNIRLNRAYGVEAVLGDAREMPGRIPPADRVIMNLPLGAIDYLDTALKLLNACGTIHMYALVPRDAEVKMERRVGAAVERLGRRPLSISSRIVRSHSPAEHHCAIDIRVE
ncbi:MAG: class I SAM-dependent methyltransferase [Thermoplasmatota archaeon]